MSVDHLVSTPLAVERRTNAACVGPLKGEVEQFLYRQSECLDTRDWDGWLDLFAPNGLYWIAAHPDDPSPDGRPSI
jgi:SnoaL-like domain